MHYIVLDLEWNQPIHTNSKSGENEMISFYSGNDENMNSDINLNRKNKLKNMPFEIIEIGAVKLDENLKEIGRFNKIVKPTLYKKMNPIISDITGIKDSDFNKEKRFPAVISEFIEWCGDDYIICTFGNQDIHELEINMHYHECEIPWRYPLMYIDIQRIFGIENNEINEQRSLEMVSLYMGISQKKVYHRALSDAIYTAEIMKKMNRNNFEKYQSLDYINLPADKSEEKEINLGTHLEYLSRAFEEKEEVIGYKDVYITRCPVCMKKCRKKLKWFSDGTKYVCAARCEHHGMIEGILYIKKNYNGYFALRKTTNVEDKRFMEIIKKKNAIREKRKIKRHKEKEKNSVL